MSKRPTLVDLAQAAGVSVATVDRVLNARHRVREPTAERVLAAAEAIGFHAAPLLKRRLRTDAPARTFGFLLQKPDAFYRQLGADIEVETHIEPMEIHEIAGSDDDADMTRRFFEALARLARQSPLLTDVHDVRLRATADGYFGIFHCRARPDVSVAQTHAAVDALEREVKQEFPQILRVVGHAEPAR